MNKYWFRLGRSDAISRITLIVVVLVQTSGSFITSLVDYTGRVPEFLLIRAAAFSAMFIVLGLGKLLLKSSIKFEIKPFIAVAIFILASVSAVFVDDTLLQLLNFTTESRFFNRLGLSIVGLPLAMIVTAMIVSGLREYTTKNQTLVETAELLLTTRRETKERLATRKADLIERIEKEISEGISAFDPQNNLLPQQELKTLLDDVVRPLSYQLDSNIETEEISIQDLPKPKVKWRSVFSSTVNEGNPFHPFTTTAWPTLTSTSFVLANFGAIGFTTGLLFFSIYSSLTWVARKMWPKISTALSPTVKAILIISVFAIIAFAGAKALSIPMNGALLTNGKIYFWIIFMEVVAWTVALLFTANRLLAEASNELVSINDELKREVLSVNSSLRQLQRGISRVLHGPVQQAIAASIYRLQLATEGLDDPQVMQEIQQRISDALTQLNDPDLSSRDLVKSFDEIVELWSGVTDISLSISAEDLSLIQASSQTTATMYELVSEACVNAIKHSEPSYINISITADSELQQILILKTCDGKPLSDSRNSGLGTQLLDEMCLSWKRYQLGDEVALEMHVPLYGS